MTYELCKKLKEAGFPQQVSCNHHAAQNCSCYEDWRPTLSELIEACGERFKSLWRHTGGTWTAEYGTRRIAPRRRCDGSTPEEAVACLWLALNKPKSI